MSDEPELTAQVRAWLEQGGYVLEMQVAKMLTVAMPREDGSPLLIEQGHIYQDPETGKDREGDIHVFLPVHQAVPTGQSSGLKIKRHLLSLTIECKKSGAPWVFFVGNHPLQHPWSPRKDFSRECPICQELERRLSALHPSEATAAYAVTEKRKGGSKDLAYEAVQQAASALLGMRDYFSGSQHDENRSTALGHAMVVTTSPIFTATIDSGGGLTLTEQPHTDIFVRRKSVPESQTYGVMVTVVNVASFPDLLADLVAPICDPTTDARQISGN